MSLIWEMDYESDRATNACIKNMEALADVAPTLTDPLEDRFPELCIEIMDSYPPADFFETNAMPIVSQKLADILTAELPREHFELLPVVLAYRGARYQESNYYFFHILHEVDALDRERSVISVSDVGGLEFVERMVLDESLASQHKLFKLAGSHVQAMVIREDLAERIEAAGCSGCSFFDPGEWVM